MKKIMVVEDDPKNTELMRRFLVRGNFEVLVPKNATEAVSMASENVPDVILMDLCLNEWKPPADGYELTVELRKIPQLNAVPIIAVSGLNFEKDKEKAKNAGCTEFIDKPVDYLKLIDRLKQLTDA